MGVVQVVIGIVAGVAVVVAGVVLLGRRRSTDSNSVRGYHQTLTTLQHLQGSPRQDQGLGGSSSGTPGATRTGPASESGALARASRRPPLSAAPSGPPSARRTQRSLVAMNHGPRRLGAPVLALVILAAVIGAIVYVGVHSHHTTPTASHTTGSTTHTTHHRSGPTTTTTTAPARYVAVSTTTSSATYAPATTSYTLSVGASTGSCWMSVTKADGTAVLAQTFTAGSTRSVTISGKATILIGAPSVASLKIDGVPVVLPQGAMAPYTVTLAPAS